MPDSPDPRLANLLGALALAVSDGVRDATEEAAGQTGAGPAAIVALDDLLAGGSIDRLRRSVALTPSGGVRLVDRLVDEGWAARQPGPDARSVSLALTPLGRQVADRVRGAREERIDHVLAVLSADERAALTTIVEKLITGVVADRLEDRAAGHEPGGGWLCRLCDPAACGRPEGRCPAATTAMTAAAPPA